MWRIDSQYIQLIDGIFNSWKPAKIREVIRMFNKIEKITKDTFYEIIENAKNADEMYYQFKQIKDEVPEYLKDIYNRLLILIEKEKEVNSDNPSNNVILEYLKGDGFNIKLSHNRSYSLDESKVKSNIDILMKLKVNNISFNKMIEMGNSNSTTKSRLKYLILDLLNLFEVYYFNGFYYLCEEGVYIVFDDFNDLLKKLNYNLVFIVFSDDEIKRFFNGKIGLKSHEINYNIFIEKISGKVYNHSFDMVNELNCHEKPVIILNNPISLNEVGKPKKELLAMYNNIYPNQFNKIAKLYQKMFLKINYKEFYGVVGETHTMKSTLFIHLPKHLGLKFLNYHGNRKYNDPDTAAIYSEDKNGKVSKRTLIGMRGKISEIYESEMKYKNAEYFDNDLNPVYLYTANDVPNMTQFHEFNFEETMDEGFRVRNVIIESSKQDVNYFKIYKESKYEELWGILIYFLKYPVNETITLTDRETDNKFIEEKSLLAEYEFDELFAILPEDINLKSFKKVFKYQAITYSVMRHLLGERLNREVTLKMIKKLINEKWYVNLQHHVMQGIRKLEYVQNHASMDYKNEEFIIKPTKSFKYVVLQKDIDRYYEIIEEEKQKAKEKLKNKKALI